MFVLTDGSRSHVAVCTSDAFHCKQLVTSSAMERPRSIVLYPTEALMFWTDWGRNSHIGVAFMDGSHAKNLVDDNIHWPNGLALDWPNGRIYWVDAKLQNIESVTIDGNDRRIILENVMKHPYGLAVFENRLYWSDWDTESIESCDKFTGKNLQLEVQGEHVFGEEFLMANLVGRKFKPILFSDLHIYHSAIMPRQKHACIDNACSHICLLGANNSYTCECPENMILQADMHKCTPNQKSYSLIISIGSNLVAIPQQTFGRFVDSVAETMDHWIDHMEFNSLTGELFVAENESRKIIAVDTMNKNTFDLIKDHIFSVKSLAFGSLSISY